MIKGSDYTGVGGSLHELASQHSDMEITLRIYMGHETQTSADATSPSGYRAGRVSRFDRELPLRRRKTGIIPSG